MPDPPPDPLGTPPDVAIQLLGTFAVQMEGRSVDTGRWAHRRAADLVALLALAPGHRLTRDQVVESLWPALAPSAGLANLHKAAHHARRALAVDDAVVLRAGTVALFPHATLVTDVERFTEAAGQALRLADPAVSAAAAELYAGDLLPDRPYDDWTVQRRDQLRGSHLELLRSAGRWQDLLAEEPTDEATHHELMRQYFDQGNRHAVIRQFQRLRAVLTSELGVRPAPETVMLYRAAVAGLTRGSPGAPLIGREVARARLGAALRGLAGGEALMVSGEAGIGKTRLCAAVLADAERVGFTVLRTSGTETDGVPYGVVLRAADRALGANPAVAGRLPDDARAALAAPGRRTTGPHPRQHLLVALDMICKQVRGSAGTVVFVDDAHLADEDSISLLGMLVRATTTPCAVLLTLRPDEAPPALAELRAEVLRRPGATEVALPRLSREESDELVTSLRGRQPAAVLDDVWLLAGGNPFFTSELAAALGDSGDVAVPATLSAAVDAQLTGLEPDLVERLRRVAVVAETVDADEFAALTGLDEQQAFQALDAALDADVLVVEGGGYCFRHALVAHHLADSVPPHRRRQIHRTAAQKLAAAGARPARVARHQLAGDRGVDAVPWLVRAAREAGTVSAYAEALRHVDAGLSVQPDHAELLALRAEYLYARGDPAAAGAFGAAVTAETGVRRTALRVQQAWVMLMTGAIPDAAQVLTEIEPDASTRTRFVLSEGILAWFTGQIDEAERAAAESRTLALASGDEHDLLDTTLLAALVAHNRGRWADRFRLDLFDPRFAGVLSGILADAHLCVGELFLVGVDDLVQVVDFASRLRRAAAEAGAARGEAFAATLLGKAELLAGDLELAEEHLLDGLRAHRTLGARGGESVALHALAEVALAGHRPAAAAPLLADALYAARLSPLSARHLLAPIFGTRIRAAVDDNAALAIVDEAHDSLARPAEACPICWVPYLLPAATLLARTGSPEAAVQMLAQAEVLVSLLWRGTGRWAERLAEARAAVAHKAVASH